jgi:hypothetical protein
VIYLFFKKREREKRREKRKRWISAEAFLRQSERKSLFSMSLKVAFFSLLPSCAILRALFLLNGDAGQERQAFPHNRLSGL